jgi:hypothetical protein
MRAELLYTVKQLNKNVATRTIGKIQSLFPYFLENWHPVASEMRILLRIRLLIVKPKSGSTKFKDTKNLGKTTNAK